jgi:hypothetical protein
MCMGSDRFKHLASQEGEMQGEVEVGVVARRLDEVQCSWRVPLHAEKKTQMVKRLNYGVQMMDDFYRGELQLKRLNYGTIVLIPKVQEVVTV